MARRQIPNSWVPLSAEERMAQEFLRDPNRLMELAAATGNRALYWIARDLLSKEQRQRR